ncbi:MAG: DNA polymerase I [Bacteroidales bacterium]|nr:DNA polymerase I [Bacteroidales bacterium]
MQKLILLDAYALIYRAYYALIKAPRINSKGMNTSAIFGFVNSLEEVLRKEQPDFIGVAFDPQGPTFRHIAYPEYKAQRDETPEGIRLAVPYIKKILAAYRIPVLEVDGFEADDVIGTLSYKASEHQDLMTYMMTLDKDYGQLVKENVLLFKPQHGSNDFERLGPKEICEKYGLNTPLQVIDMLGLMGDNADNIPGCPGIGPKTAIQLIQQFGSIEKLLDHTDELKGALKTKVENNKEQIKTSKWLATIKIDVPIDLDFNTLRREEPNKEELHSLFTELEFSGLLNRRNLIPDTIQTERKSEVKKVKNEVADGQLDLFASAETSTVTTASENKSNDELVIADGTTIGYDIKKFIVEHEGKDIDTNAPMFDIMLANYVLNSSIHGMWVRPSVEEKNRLTEELKKEGLYSLFADVEMPLAPVLARMEMNGVRIDTESLAETSRDFASRMNSIEKEIYELAGEQFNISSPRQVGEVLFDKLKIVDKAKKTKTGQYVTSEEVLQNLKGKHPVIDKILDYRGYKKLLSTYIDALPRLINPKTGHIHTTFNQAITSTGRLSSSNPNLQNIPIRDENGREVRKAFIPDEGCLFFSADYSQIELRIMAHLSGDENLIEAFREGHDIHAATAAKIFKKPISEVTPDERRKAKTANFGIIYGISTFGLAERMQVPRAEAKELIDGYFATYAKVKEYMDKSIDLARDNMYTETLFGRRCYLPDINSRNSVVRGYAERNAINAPIQGTAADIIKVAMINIDRRMQREGLRSKMILQVHDELNFSVYPEEKEVMEHLVVEEMQNAFKMQVPLVADCGWGKNWLEAH